MSIFARSHNVQRLSDQSQAYFAEKYQISNFVYAKSFTCISSELCSPKLKEFYCVVESMLPIQE